MVRNTPSTQSLRDSMNASSSGDSYQEAQAQQQPLQRLDGPSMQLCGNDQATKALMTKVATGQASESEQAAFNMHVNQARSLPSINNILQSSSNEKPALPKKRSSRLPYDPTTPHQHSGPAQNLAELGRRNEQAMQELMLEKQQLDQRIADTQARTLAFRPRTADNIEGPQHDQTIYDAAQSLRENKALADYQLQLALLDQQNKQRLMIARAEQDGMPDRSNHALQDYQMQMMLLEQQNKKRLLMRRQDHENNCYKQATADNAASYTKPFCEFLTENPTVFHCVAAMKKQLLDAGFTQLSERDSWDLEKSGAYFVERNGSSLIAFVAGSNYTPGNGAAILAGHVDALTAKLKPISQVPNKAGYLQLGVAPYAGGLGKTWWDRDLGIGGRVHVKEGDKIVTKLVKLDWPIAKIPTLAEHFGAAAQGPYNKETQMVPIIGLDNSDSSSLFHLAEDGFSQPPLLGSSSGSIGSFAKTQPPALVKAISHALGLEETSGGASNIVNWELELFDVQPATTAGLNRELISAGRIDDKLCSWAALQALIESHKSDTEHSGLIKVVGLFDDEEIGSLLRQGAKGNFLPMTIERAVESLKSDSRSSITELVGRTYAKSFMVSSDVTHAVNPNFLNAYLENHAPHLNVGIAVAADSNGHMTTDSLSTSILKRCADKVGAKLQVFQIRNDSRSGGTVGPMLSSAMGVRAIDAGLAQLSMHSIRATTGALDPGFGVLTFLGFLNGFESVDKEFQDS